MILVCHNVFGLFVQHTSWSVEEGDGGDKVSKLPVAVILRYIYQSGTTS